MLLRMEGALAPALLALAVTFDTVSTLGLALMAFDGPIFAVRFRVACLQRACTRIAASSSPQSLSVGTPVVHTPHRPGPLSAD